MPHYTVTWSIDIFADDEEAAAAEALAIQRNPRSIATVFEVTDQASGQVTGVDLVDNLARGGNATGGNTPTDRALDAVQDLSAQAWFYVETPGTFREVQLPIFGHAWSPYQRRQYGELEELAELHGTTVRRSEQRRG